MKTKQLTPTARAKIVNSCIRDVWASMDSHLDFISDPKISKKSQRFHRVTTLEYSALISKLVKLY